MVPRPGANARRNDAGGHRVFAGTPGTQVVKTSGRDVPTRLHDHEAAAAGADRHTACYPGNHRITLGVIGAQATTRLPGTRPPGHTHAEIAARIGVPDPAPCHGITADPVGDLDLPRHLPARQPPGHGPDGHPGMAPGHPAALALPELRAQEQSCHGTTHNPALSSAARRS
jgi:hypothetical protein